MTSTSHLLQDLLVLVCGFVFVCAMTWLSVCAVTGGTRGVTKGWGVSIVGIVPEIIGFGEILCDRSPELSLE